MQSFSRLILLAVERPVKERLVGAAVLVAAAVILIPEMLSGPDRDEPAARAQPTAQTSSVPMKTYTIDLTRSPGDQQVTPDTLDTRAPPPEESPEAAFVASAQNEQLATSEPQVNPESPPDVAAAEPAASDLQPGRAQSEPVAAEPEPRRAAPEPEPPKPAPQSPPVTASPTPRALASQQSAPKSGAWAVQLGSFSKQESAERLAKQMRDQGHDAFVMPVKSGASTLYRVRVGPMQDRASAEATLSRIKPKVPGAAVVAHR